MADFKIQRGQSNIGASTATVTITAGTDYDAPASITKAFIKIVAHNHNGNGTSTAFGGHPHRNQVCIDNPGNLLTSITFSREDSSTSQVLNIEWEIIEYTGSAGGANEFKVLGQEVLTIASTNTTADSSAWTPADDNDVVAFITGQRQDDTSGIRGDCGENKHTSEWVAASNLIRITRGSSANSSRASVAAVEFTGSNWKIQRVSHSFSAADTDETESITTISAVTEAFLHVQSRDGSNNSAEYMWFRAWITSTTQVTFRASEIGNSHTVVAWVIENADLTVQHLSGTWSASASDPDTNDVSITAVSSLAETSVEGLCAGHTGASVADTHQAMVGAALTSTSNLRLYRGISDEEREYKVSVVEWPAATSTTHEGALTLAVDAGFTPTADISLEGSVSFAAQVDETVSADAVYEPSITFDTTENVTFTSDAVLEAAFAEQVNAGFSTTLGSILEAALSFDVTADYVITADVSIEGAVTFSVDASNQYSVDANLEASQIFATDLALNIINDALLEAGVSIGSNVSVSFSTDAVSVTVTTPEGRIIVINAENRIKLINAENRIELINPEDRTLKVH